MNTKSTLEAIQRVFEELRNMNPYEFENKLKLYEDSELQNAFNDLAMFGEYLEDKYMWNFTNQILPPENVVVETMDSGGSIQKLMRSGNLFWFPDGSMYVYYCPVKWRNI